MKLLVYSVNKDIIPLLKALKKQKDLVFIEGYFNEFFKTELISLGVVKENLRDAIDEVNSCWIPDLKETRNDKTYIIDVHCQIKYNNFFIKKFIRCFPTQRFSSAIINFKSN